ncbi:MAG TPA: hypothetical protein DEB40_01665 [Elusimicrobia bacterium]|nr:hypothetical protein [Elusimicrobiota bacterium]HBT60437.1 hypothetical protein [Elusimicrobiota bacterium]
MSPACRVRPFLAGALLWIGCAGLPRPMGPPAKVVEAEGWAPLESRDAETTRRRALADAQRRAAEKVNGVSVTASSLVAEGVGVISRVLAESSGGIAHYDVLGESEENGFLKIRIRARVLIRPVGAPAESPPLGINLMVTVKADGPQAEELESAAQTALRRQLLARGFGVIEASGSSRADMTLRAQARAYKVKDPRLGELRSYAAILNLSAVRPDTGEVAWEGVSQASALDTDEGAASVKAVAAAGRLAGEDAAAALSRIFWQRF